MALLATAVGCTDGSGMEGSDAGGGGGGDNTGLPCDPECRGAMMCNDDGQCVCAPGWGLGDETCEAVTVSDPATRSREEVCARWEEDRMFATPLWTPGTGDMCDPGTVSFEAQVSGLRWLNFWRWMLGIGPVQVAPEVAEAEQQCAKLLGFEFSHSPSPETPCYTEEGAAACGASLIASGHGLTGQLDAYAMEVDQNLVHRRNVLSVGRAGVWLGDAGGPAAMHYGGSYPALESDPEIVAHPGPGLMIASMVPRTWFVQAGTTTIPPVDARVFVADTDEEMPMTRGHYFGDFSSFSPEGWTPQLDTPYRIELIDETNTPLATWQTTFITCP